MINKKELLEFIYQRMIKVHGENDYYDYMLNFKNIIDNMKDESQDDYFLQWKQFCTFKNIIDDLVNGKTPDLPIKKYDLTDEQISLVIKVSKSMGYKTIE